MHVTNITCPSARTSQALLSDLQPEQSEAGIHGYLSTRWGEGGGNTAGILPLGISLRLFGTLDLCILHEAETGDTAQGYTLQTRPETPDEFRARLAEAVAAAPNDYFLRADMGAVGVAILSVLAFCAAIAFAAISCVLGVLLLGLIIAFKVGRGSNLPQR